MIDALSVLKYKLIRLMVTFRNNNNVRRNNFRRNDRNFKSNGDRPKFGSNYSNNENFKRKAPGRNNHNAPKLIEKYNDLQERPLQMEIKFYLKIIFNMQIILQEF
jgi:hypothetical protein